MKKKNPQPQLYPQRGFSGRAIEAANNAFMNMTDNAVIDKSGNDSYVGLEVARKFSAFGRGKKRY